MLNFKTAAVAALIAIAPAASAHSQTNIWLADGGAVSAEALDSFFDQSTQSGMVTGLSVAIINDFELVYHHTSGLADQATGEPVSAQHLFEGASLSKPLFGALVVRAVSQGLIELDTPLATYYRHPDLSGQPYADMITARMVLTHTTGLPNWRSDRSDGRLQFQFEPGTGHLYSGEGYEYLADVLMHVLDLDDAGLDAYFRREIGAEAGLERTRFYQSSELMADTVTGYRDGIPVGPGEDFEFGAAHSIHSEAEEYATALIELVHGSALTPDERSALFTPQSVPIAATDPNRAVGLTDWTLGFAVYDLPVGRFYGHGGNNAGYTNLALINQETGWGIAIFTNEDQANEYLLHVFSVLAPSLNLAPPPADSD